jgi:hypothetical protein
MGIRARPCLLASVGLAMLATGCQRTGAISPALNEHFEKEDILRRADDLTFRRTIAAGQRNSSWEDRRASIIVTKESVFLHVNDKPLVEITPRSTGFYEIHRDHDRLSLRAGGGKSAVSWSFHPPDDAEGWATDIRAVIRKAKSR